MPRPSFSENPLLRVSRPVSACSRCRAAKVKCDGKLPACTACEKAGRESECSAANDQFARGKERSYVAALELRIEKLERRLAFARSRKASVAQHGDTENGPPQALPEMDRKDSLATIRAAIHRKAARKRENSDVNSLVSDFGFLSVNATTRDFEPAASNMTFARLVIAAVTNDPVLEPKAEKLPSRQVAYNLVQWYLTNVFALFPAFSETVLLSALDNFYQPDKPPIKSTDYWLLYMVLAIACSAQSRSTQDDYYAMGVDFVGHALPYADRALRPGYPTQILSLLLLTQYSTFDPAHFDSWHLIGFTCRAVVDLGYHQDPPQSQVADRGALEARRKLFYCVYALDRAISMVHARAFSFTDEAINVAYPSANRLSHALSVAGPLTAAPAASPALLLFQLRRAQSHWYQTLFQSDPNDPLADSATFIWQMCQEMREWGDSLPDTLPPAVRQVFDLELRYSYVYCIAPSARAPHTTAYGRMLIFEHAIAYLDQVYEVAHSTATDSAAAFSTYHDALRVFFMGSQFLAVLRDAGEALLAGASVPVPLTLPGKAPPPPIPARLDTGPGHPRDNLDRSARCLAGVGMTLQKWGERYRDALSLRDSFEQLSREMRNELNVRMAEREQARQHHAQQRQMNQQPFPSGHYITPPPQQSGMMPPMMQPRSMMAQSMPGPQEQSQQAQPQQVTQGQPQRVTWVDVDVAQIIRGGGGI